MSPQDEDLYWLTSTLIQETGGEPIEGKLGVAWSIMNRVWSPRYADRVLAVVLQPWQYSCWNTNSPTKKLLTTRQPETWAACEVAAKTAFDAMGSDPTHGSTHYLRPEHCPNLPPWYRKELVRAKLGHHEFLLVD